VGGLGLAPAMAAWKKVIDHGLGALLVFLTVRFLLVLAQDSWSLGVFCGCFLWTVVAIRLCSWAAGHIGCAAPQPYHPSARRAIFLSRALVEPMANLMGIAAPRSPLFFRVFEIVKNIVSEPPNFVGCVCWLPPRVVGRV
jgi:hypothetical protein